MTFGPFPTPFRLDRMRNASSQAFDHLRDLIITMTLAPGTQLDRNELQEYYGLSSTPVRDALTRLGDEGLIEIIKQYATRVRGIDPDAVREAVFLRLSMELEVVALLAQQRDAILLHSLQSLVAQQALFMSRQDFDGFVRTDMEFHRQMFTAAGFEDLWHFLRNQSGNLDRLRRLHVPIAEKAKLVVAEHSALLSAIAAGDAELAQSCLREHLSGSLQQLDTLQARYPAYFVAKP